MKKFFTLIAALLLTSGSVFAQAKYENKVVNGDLEGEADPEWSSFWCHEFREAGESQFQGFANVVEDPADATNHCAVVVIRSEAEADEAGNKIKDNNGNFASWDSQFFIYATETIPEGKEVRMSLRVKGLKAGSFETQAHWTPGDYNHYILFGNFDFGTEWTTIVSEPVTISADQSQEANGKFFQSVAFNLTTTKEGNTVYFDDIKLEVRDPKAPQEFEGWFNFLRKGTLSDDKIAFGNGTFTNFTGRDGATGKDVQARIVNDPVDGAPALNVTSIGFNAQQENKTAIVDDEGNPVLDEAGNPTYDITYTDMYIKENGDTLKKQDGSIGIDDWQTQFFISSPHKFKTGQKFKFIMWARADKPATIQTQIHRGPGDYLHYELLGNLDLTEEWQQFVFEDKEITSSQNGGSTFAFNCNVLKEINNYYFRFEDFSTNSADVLDSERVLASETISLPLGENNKDVTAKVDMTAAVEALGVEDLSVFVDDYSMKIQVEEGFGELVQPTTGAFIDDKGLFTEAEKGIILTVEEETEGNTANFVITNADSGVESGQPVDSKIVFVSKDGWYYLYNLHFISEEAYTGIAPEAIAKKPASGAVFNLLGQKVANVQKGRVYIQDGKTFIAK